MKKSVLCFGIALCCIAGTTLRAVVPNRDSAAYYLRMGNDAAEGRKLSTAWQYYEKAASFDAHNTEIQYKIADVCTKMNKMAPAIKALENVYAAAPTDKAIIAKLTEVYFFYNQWDKATQFAMQVLKQDPAARGMNFIIGKSYYSRKNYGNALVYLDKAIHEDGRNAEAHYLAGRTWIQMSNYKKAEPHYAAATTLDTAHPERSYEYAMLLSTIGNFSKSIEWFERSAAQGYPASDEFYKNLAYTCIDAHQTERAVDIMKKMLETRPMDMDLLNNIAEAYYKGGKNNDAIRYWDKMLSYDDKNARTLYSIGMAYLKAGKKEDGQALCDRAIAMDPSLGVLKHQKQMQ